MDLYKYIAVVFILTTLTIMSGTMSSPEQTIDDYFGSNEEKNQGADVRTQTADLADPDYIYTPQNEDTQTEGSGGVSIEKTTQGGYSIFTNLLRYGTEQKDLAEQGIETKDTFARIMWVAISLFWTIFGGYGIIKLVNFIKNKDTT